MVTTVTVTIVVPHNLIRANWLMVLRIVLRYGCRNGRCSSCKYFLIEGEVDFGKTSPYCLTDNEKDEGWALLCQARALSDLGIRDQHRVWVTQRAHRGTGARGHFAQPSP